MADERNQGTLRPIGGIGEEGLSKTVGNTNTEVKDLIKHAAGAVEGAYGTTKDTAMEGAQIVKGAAIEGHDFLRKFMKDNPHTTTVIALGIGLLIGYAAHRPPSRSNWWD